MNTREKAHPPEGASRRAVRQTLWLTAAAAIAFVGIRSLPVDRGTLHYDDFHAGGKGMLEFCEPGGPQFVPVDRVRSPVALELRTVGPLRAGERTALIARLTSASGKPVTSDDLLVTHTRKLHLLCVDPTLEDYQHLHPVATDAPGEFAFEFTPRHGGSYRVFADFTPRATGRALYAGTALEVAAAGTAGEMPAENAGTREAWVIDVEGYRFALATSTEPVRINETSELRLTVRQVDGALVQLEEVMGAQAHVVAFDTGRTGFAHLHPLADGEGDAAAGALRFQLHLTDPGRYRLWAQVKIKGREVFAPFDVTVQP